MNHEEMSVDLGDAGSITLSIDVDVWSISESDAAWVLGLVRTMRELAKLHMPENAAATTGQEKPKHQVEAFRQLVDGTTRVGWQCLTCGIEKLVPDFGPFAGQAAEAERQANAHVAAIVRPSTGDEETT